MNLAPHGLPGKLLKTDGFPQITEFPKPEFMSKSLEELQIGTYANIAMVRTTTPVYVALGIFVQHRVSALPVVDEKGE